MKILVTRTVTYWVHDINDRSTVPPLHFFLPLGIPFYLLLILGWINILKSYWTICVQVILKGFDNIKTRDITVERPGPSYELEFFRDMSGVPQGGAQLGPPAPDGGLATLRSFSGRKRVLSILQKMSRRCQSPRRPNSLVRGPYPEHIPYHFSRERERRWVI